MDVSEVYLPPIPENLSDLEEYIRSLCCIIDHVGRTREAAKQKLQELRFKQPFVHKEREERRKLEAENRALKRELAEIRWRESVFSFPEQ